MIDADDAVKRLREAEKDMRFVRSVGCKAIDFAVVPKFIEGMPTIDAVPVVRCKECKHYEIHRPKVWENCERNGHLIPMSPDDFCSYGERRSE